MCVCVYTRGVELRGSTVATAACILLDANPWRNVSTKYTLFFACFIVIITGIVMIIHIPIIINSNSTIVTVTGWYIVVISVAIHHR